jgi:hypothetical protein
MTAAELVEHVAARLRRSQQQAERPRANITGIFLDLPELSGK